jgi:hypothetical protein
MDDETAARLKEYDALRAEILQIMSRQGVRGTVAWPVVMGLLAAAATSHTPELAPLAVIVSASSWIDHIQLSRAIVRIGVYLRYAVEPRVPGLAWESFNGSRLTAIYRRASPIERFDVAVRSSYGLLTTVAAFGALAVLTANWPLAAPRALVVLVFALAASGVAIVAFRMAAAHADQRHNEERLIEPLVRKYFDSAADQALPRVKSTLEPDPRQSS